MDAAALPDRRCVLVLAAVESDDAQVVEYLLGEALPGLPEPARRLLRDAAHLDGLPIGLAEELGHRNPAVTTALLTRVGLAARGEDRDCRPVPALAAAITGHQPIRADHLRRLWTVTARWNRDQDGHLDAAVAARAGDRETCAAVLSEHGPTFITGGGARTYISLVESAGVDDPAALLSYGDALSVVGRHADERAHCLA